MKRVEEGAGELVISRGDSAVDFQVTDHMCSTVALAIHAPVPGNFGLAIGFGRMREQMPALCRLALECLGGLKLSIAKLPEQKTPLISQRR
jgi:hypothetical protein